MTHYNPLLEAFDTPPFSRVENAHYLPAVEASLVSAREEIGAITAQTADATFENTIEALERVGSQLDRVLGVFYPLLSANADDEMMDISLEISAKLNEYSADVSLNRELFKRVKAVYDSKPEGLTPEQQTLLENSYLGFTRAGALLEGEDREKYRDITRRLSELTTRFGQNVKKELATYRIDATEAELEGVPAHIVDNARRLAADEGREAEFTLTLEQPVYMAVMKLAHDRNLREKLYRLYSSRNTDGEFSNTAIVAEIAELRLRLSRLLGYETFAHYKLERTMAQTPEAVYDLLNNLLKAYEPALKKELEAVETEAGHKIEPWDYSYYSNLLRKRLHDFDEEELRPYFELTSVVDGVFSLANRLYGITLSPIDTEVYEPDVKAYEISDADGSRLGLLYADFFTRPGRKSPGAWMTEFREADATERPLVNIVMNFTRPTAGHPTLLTPSEVETLLHEFGHSLHSLLTRVRYSSLAGTNVRRDFVELPSQFMENFLTRREFLDSFARHHISGQPLPEWLLERMTEARRFGAAYACVRQLNFGFLDMAWHSITTPVASVADFERKATDRTTPVGVPEDSMISTSFGHIFSGGYAAGYYSYKWAEVLDADAYAYFEECGPFSGKPAEAFRREILEKGGSEHPSVLYRRFRGRDASVDALIKRDLR